MDRDFDIFAGDLRAFLRLGYTIYEITGMHKLRRRNPQLSVDFHEAVALEEYPEDAIYVGRRRTNRIEYAIKYGVRMELPKIRHGIVDARDEKYASVRFVLSDVGEVQYGWRLLETKPRD